MKVLAIALAALTGVSEAKKVINSAELNRRLKNGLVNKQTLMAGAKPANEYTKRKLENNQFQINGYYSIQFNSCVSMTVQNDEVLNDENFVTMAANGDLISEKDYILFNVCETEYCSYVTEDEKMTFIADVGTYFQAVSQYLPTKVQDYCDACNQNYDYCYAMANGQQYYPEGYEPEEEVAEEEAAGDDAVAAEGEDEAAAEGEEDAAAEGEDAAADGGRKKARKLQNGQVVKFIDCQMCADYECLDFQQSSSNGYYDENGDFIEAELDDAMEWLNGFSECAATMAYLDEYLLYSGLMCNADGSGLEIGLFLDDGCLMYTPKVAYKDVMQDVDQTYYGMISDIVEFTFANDGIECYDPEVVWYNEVDYAYKQQNGEIQEEQQQEDNGEAPEAAEWCREVTKNDAVDLYDCGGYYPEEDANANQEGDDAAAAYEWYSYEITEQNAENIAAVCYAIKQMENENHAHTVFNNEHEGLFNYHRNKKSKSSGMSAGGIVGIVLLVLVAGGGAFGAMTYYKKKSSEDKKKPLINEEGQLA